MINTNANAQNSRMENGTLVYSCQLAQDTDRGVARLVKCRIEQFIDGFVWFVTVDGETYSNHRKFQSINWALNNADANVNKLHNL